ncbi:MAG: hypothetical protein Rhob2KO_31500 [Rhodopirellula baltica]
MSRADVAHAVQNAAASPRAVVFIYVPWAPIRPQTDRFAELAASWHSDTENNAVGFHFIDFSDACDDYRPLTDLPGWPTQDERPHLGRIGGWGELVWIANGTIVHIQSALDFSAPSSLFKLTNQLFDIQNRG